MEKHSPPDQFTKKLVHLMILNMLEGKSLPVYGEGKNVRDWLYVEDHASAICAIMTPQVTAGRNELLDELAALHGCRCRGVRHEGDARIADRGPTSWQSPG